MKLIRLTKAHQHEGTKYAKGAVLLLDGRVADWLIEQGAAEATTAGKAVNSAPTATRIRSGCCGGRW